MTLEEFYTREAARPLQMSAHMAKLRELATGLDHAIEFGVRGGASTSALLLGAQRVTSYDVRETQRARELEKIAGPRWTYRLQDSKIAPVEPCDLLFIDSLHTFRQCDAELKRHGDSATTYIVFHDTVSWGERGERGEVGISPAIDAFLARDQSWKVFYQTPASGGFLALVRS